MPGYGHLTSGGGSTSAPSTGFGPRSGGGGFGPRAGGFTLPSGGGGFGPLQTSHVPAKHGGGGSLFGDIVHDFHKTAHYVSAKTALAGHDILGIPGGAYQMATTGAQAVSDDLHGRNAKANKAFWHDLAHGHPVRAFEEYSKPENAGSAQSRLWAMELGMAAPLKHPLRDPFATAMTVLPLTHGLGKFADVASGGRIMDTPRLITQRPGAEPVALKASQNPAYKLLQHAHDRIIQRALDTNPEGRAASYATKRIEGSIAETTRATERANASPADVLEAAGRTLHRGPIEALRGKGVSRKLSEAALRLTSENNTPEDAAAFHRAQADKGIAVKQNLRMAALNDRVAKAGLVIRDAEGNAVIDKAAYPHLANVDALVAEGQARVDQIAKDYGLMSEEQLAYRRNAPARIRAGAQWVEPTPGRLGVLTPAHKIAIALVDRLEKEHYQSLTKAKGAAEKTAANMEPPLSKSELADAHAQLAQLEKEHVDAVSEVARGMFGNPGRDKAEIARRNAENAKAVRQASGKTRGGRAAGASGRKAVIRPTVAQEDFNRAEQAVQDAIAKNPDSPVSKAWQHRIDQLDTLRRGLGPEAHALFGEEGVTPLTREQVGREPLYTAVGTRVIGPGKVIAAKGATAAERKGAALSVARDRLERMNAAAAARIEPTGFVGGEGALPGRGYVTYRTRGPRPSRTTRIGSTSNVVERARSFIPKKRFRGEGLAHGLVPDKTTSLVAQQMRAAARFVNTNEFRDVVARTGSPVKRSDLHDIQIRLPGADTSPMAAAVRERLVNDRSNLNQLPDDEGQRVGFAAFVKHILPGLEDNFALDREMPPGTEAEPGYAWVDRRLLGDLGRPSSLGPRNIVGRGFDNVNTAVTAATVYFKLGHIPQRFVTNAVTNIIQGSAGPLEIRDSVRLWKALSAPDRKRALGLAGQHGYEAMPMREGLGKISGPVSTGARGGANWYARHVDAPFRFNSIAYEARRAGYDTPAKFREFMDTLQKHGEGTDPKTWAKIQDAAKRANRENIAYDRLSQGERRFITRGFWFYPWTAGATRWAVNTALEHPYKSAALAVAGRHGREQQLADLGPLPSYEGGLFQVGGAKGRGPLVMDLSSEFPWSTPGNLMQLPSFGRLSEFANPGVAAFLQVAARQNQYGQHTNDPIGSALSQLVSPTPEAQILAAYLQRHKDQSNRMFNRTPLSALARATLGTWVPRRVNVNAGASAYAREQAGR